MARGVRKANTKGIDGLLIRKFNDTAICRFADELCRLLLATTENLHGNSLNPSVPSRAPRAVRCLAKVGSVLLARGEPTPHAPELMAPPRGSSPPDTEAETPMTGSFSRQHSNALKPALCLQG